MSIEVVNDTMSKGEKKARGALAKLGLVHVENISGVTIKSAKNPTFNIASPQVYKNTANNTYIVFGAPRVDNMQAAIQALQNKVKMEQSNVDEKHVDMLMTTAKVSREAAVQALVENNNDSVQALLALRTE